MKVCIFASSSDMIAQRYADDACSLGRELGLAGHEIVYGGGGTGLMGKLADAALEAGGKVTGVIPQFMQDEGWGHLSATSMIMTPDMHSRKERMFSLSDAIVALPGGIGTLEELTEAITLKQLGLFNGAIVILNTLNFYNELLQLLDKMIEGNFMRQQHRTIWSITDTPKGTVEELSRYVGWIPDPRSIAKI
jgi:uncharacterized protein (TIGR00730 family)